MLTNALFLDPSMFSANVGDQIIREGVVKALSGRVNLEDVLPTQRRLSRGEMRSAAGADLAFVGGTNLLSSNMPFYQQWKIGPVSARALRNKVVLLGVGWWQYQPEPNAYTRWLLGQVLSTNHVHSVRDEYTKERLEKLGFKAVNTACPTMWDLPASLELGARPDTCIVTLTDYNRDESDDQWMLDEVAKHYRNVIVWPQSERDVVYAERLRGTFAIAGPTLNEYDALLHGSNVDYVGTRLHGGIRAAQAGHWSLIIAVDNRGIEIGRDTGLLVVPRGDRERAARALEHRMAPDLHLPQESIDAWASQFGKTARNDGASVAN